MESFRDNEISRPWQRTDRYGEMGLAPQPVLEYVRLGLMLALVVPIKIIGAFTCLVSFWIWVQLAAVLFPAKYRSGWVAWLGKIHCRSCLFFMGFVRVRWVAVDSDGEPVSSPQSGPSPAGIVSNHLSWADILVHMSHFFPAFVARSSTAKTPFVGSISKAMGCLYVERAKSKDETSKTDKGAGSGVSSLVKARMESSQRSGERPLLLFPEGTTTNGRFLLPFKSGAFLAGQPVQPVIIQYGGRGMSPSWESMVIKRHIVLLLCQLVHSVTCFTLPCYIPNDAERADPTLFAANVRSAMLKASKGKLRPSQETYIDKVQFNDALKRKHGYVRDEKAVRDEDAKAQAGGRVVVRRLSEVKSVFDASADDEVDVDVDPKKKD